MQSPNSAHCIKFVFRDIPDRQRQRRKIKGNAVKCYSAGDAYNYYMKKGGKGPKSDFQKSGGKKSEARKNRRGLQSDGKIIVVM